MATSGTADNVQSVLTRAGTLQGTDRNITSVGVGSQSLHKVGADDPSYDSGSGLLPRKDDWSTALRIGNQIGQMAINSSPDGTFPIKHASIFASPTGYDIHGQLIVAAAATDYTLDSDVAVSGLPYLAATSNYQFRAASLDTNAYATKTNG
jgi:hypothetical protein